MSAKYEHEARGLLRIAGAVVTNDHFVYAAGDHGSVYVNKDDLFVNPLWCSDLAEYLAYEVAGDFIETVVGAVVGGAILANRVAEHLSRKRKAGVDAVFADRDGDGFVIRRGYPAHVKGRRVLVVEDILNTGKTVRAVLKAVQDAGGSVIRVAALYNRGGVRPEDIGFPSHIVSLIDERQEKWPEADCPLCQQGVPINTELGKGREFLTRQRG